MDRALIALAMIAQTLLIFTLLLESRSAREHLHTLQTRILFLEVHLGITYVHHSNPTAHEWYPTSLDDLVDKYAPDRDTAHNGDKEII